MIIFSIKLLQIAIYVKLIIRDIWFNEKICFLCNYMYQYTYCSYLRRIDIKGIELTWYVSVTLVFPHKSMSHSNMIPAALCSSAYACHLHATSKLFIPLIMYKYSSIGSGILLHWYIVLLVIIFLLYLSQTLCLPKN